MTTTPNLGLTVVSNSAGSVTTFNDWRLSLDGTTSSNMTLIDDFAGTTTNILSAVIQNQVIYVHATFVSTNYFESNTVSGVTSYVPNMIICADFDQTNSGSILTLNINGLGVRSIYKQIQGGIQSYLSGNDIVMTTPYFFQYKNSSNAWILISGIVGSGVPVSGSIGNLVQIVTNGSVTTIGDAGISPNSIYISGSVQQSGSSIGKMQPVINFVSGSNITLSVVNNSSASSTIITINSTGGSSGSGLSSIIISGSNLSGSGIAGSPLKFYVGGANNTIPVMTDSGSNLISSGSTIAQIIASASSTGGSSYANDYLMQGRLSLSSASTVPTVDIVGATTIYLLPSDGNQVALYSGTSWSNYTLTSASVSVPATTGSGFDIFAYPSGSVIMLETLNWSGSSVYAVRATALVRQDGVYVKSGSPTRRYLGSGYSGSVSGRCDDNTNKRMLWNYYNKVDRTVTTSSSTVSWAYTGSVAIREYNNGTGQTRGEFMLGDYSPNVMVSARTYFIATGSPTIYGGVSLDSTTGLSTTYATSNGTTLVRVHPFATTTANAGYHYITQTEYASSGSVTFYGSGYSGNATFGG